MAGAECEGGSDLRTLPGFWRSQDNAVAVYPCTDTRPCAGDVTLHSVSSGNATCNVGYYGPLCAVCEEGYFSFSNGCTCACARSYAPNYHHESNFICSAVDPRLLATC